MCESCLPNWHVGIQVFFKSCITCTYHPVLAYGTEDEYSTGVVVTSWSTLFTFSVIWGGLFALPRQLFLKFFTFWIFDCKDSDKEKKLPLRLCLMFTSDNLKVLWMSCCSIIIPGFHSFCRCVRCKRIPCSLLLQEINNGLFGIEQVSVPCSSISTVLCHSSTDHAAMSATPPKMENSCVQKSLLVGFYNIQEAMELLKFPFCFQGCD